MGAGVRSVRLDFIFSAMESIFLYPADRARARRRRMQLLQAMLRALAKPLLLVRQARRRVKDLGRDENIHRSLEALLHELSLAAHAVTRQLNACGVREARRAAWKKATTRLRRYWANATEWSRQLIIACRGCAARLCGLFRAAQALEDRTSTRLAYSLLRTLEKELWFLQSNTPSAWHAHRA